MSVSATTIYVAIELSNTLWLVGTRLPGAEKARMHRIEVGNVTALLALLGDLHLRATTKLDQPPLLRAASRQAAMGSGYTGF